MAAFVVLLVVATLSGFALLWPEQRKIPRPEELGPPARTEKAEIVGVRATPCGAATGRGDCLRVSAEVQSGPDRGDEVVFTFAAVEGDFDVGDDIRVHKNVLPPDAVVAGVEVEPYSFSDFERRQPMLGLLVMFAALVLVTGRWQGLRALAGLAASLAVISFFIVPAILEGSSPTAVAFVGALAIMLVTLPLAHGIGPKTMAASLGTAASLALTLALGHTFIRLAHLSGCPPKKPSTFAPHRGSSLSPGLAARGHGHRSARRAR